MDPPLIEQDSWTTAQLRKSEKLTLATDVGLLKCMQHLSQKIVTQTSNLLKVLDDLQKDGVAACVQVEHCIQQLNLISTKQYVENRVYDEEVSERQTSNMLVEQETSTGIDFVPIIKNALAYGLSIQHLQMDSNDNLQLKLDQRISDENLPLRKSHATNGYAWRPLPHLIGSEEFLASPTAGILGHSPREIAKPISTKPIEPPPSAQSSSDSFNNDVSQNSFTSHSPVDEILPIDHNSTEEQIPETSAGTNTQEECGDRQANLLPGFQSLQAELSSRLRLPQPQLSVSSEQAPVKPSIAKQNSRTEEQPVTDTKHLYSTLPHSTEQNEVEEHSSIPKVQVIQQPKQQNLIVAKPERKRASLFDESSESDDDLFKIPSQSSHSSSTILKGSSNDDLFNIGPRSSSAASDVNKTSPDTSTSNTSTVSKVSSSAALSSGGSNSFISSTTTSNMSALSSSTRKDKLFFSSDSDDEDLFADAAKKPTLPTDKQTLLTDDNDDLFAGHSALPASSQVSTAPTVSATGDSTSFTSGKKSSLKNANGGSVLQQPKQQRSLFDNDSYDDFNFMSDSKKSTANDGNRDEVSSQIVPKSNLPVSSNHIVSKAASSGKSSHLCSLFDDDDDDSDIFNIVGSAKSPIKGKTEQKEIVSKSIPPNVSKSPDSKSTKKVAIQAKSMSLFGDTDSDDDLFGNVVTNSKGNSNLPIMSSSIKAESKDASEYPILKDSDTLVVPAKQNSFVQNAYLDGVVDEIKPVDQVLKCDTTEAVTNLNKEPSKDRVAIPPRKLADEEKITENGQIIQEDSKNPMKQLEKDVASEKIMDAIISEKEIRSNGTSQSNGISKLDHLSAQENSKIQNGESLSAQSVGIDTLGDVGNNMREKSVGRDDKDEILEDGKLILPVEDHCENAVKVSPTSVIKERNSEVKSASTSLFPDDSDSEEDLLFGNKTPALPFDSVGSLVKSDFSSSIKQSVIDKKDEEGSEETENRSIVSRPKVLPLPGMSKENRSQQSPTKSLIASLKQTLSEQSNSPTSPPAGDPSINSNRKPFGGVSIFGPGFPGLPHSSIGETPESEKEVATDENKNDDATLVCPGKYRPRIQNQRRLPSRYHRRSKVLDTEDSDGQAILGDGRESSSNLVGDILDSSVSHSSQQPISNDTGNNQSNESTGVKDIKKPQEREKSKLVFEDSDSSDGELFKKPITKDASKVHATSTKINWEPEPSKIVSEATNKRKEHTSLFGDDSDSDDALFSGKVVLPSANKRLGIALHAESDEDDLFKTAKNHPSEKKTAPTTSEKPAFSDPLLGSNEW